MNKLKTNSEWIKYPYLMEKHPRAFHSSNELGIITDENRVAEFESETGRTIGVTYESPYRIMVVDLVYDGKNYFDGMTFLVHAFILSMFWGLKKGCYFATAPFDV